MAIVWPVPSPRTAPNPTLLNPYADWTWDGVNALDGGVVFVTRGLASNMGCATNPEREDELDPCESRPRLGVVLRSSRASRRSTRGVTRRDFEEARGRPCRCVKGVCSWG